MTRSGMPSPVNIANRHRIGVIARGKGLLRLEGAVAVAQQHAHRVVA